MADVRLEHLTKEFSGGTVAVDDVNLAVADGEFLVLVGPSGCGKSTVLRMVAGLEEVSGGEVYIAGRPVTDLPPKARDIAMVFQNYALYPHMTVAENLGFSLRLRKTRKREAREQVDETARALGLTELLKRKPAALSGGQRQRVAMGRALVRKPQVFLMDEPLSNLDAKLRVSMRGELTRLHQQYRITTLYVTHDQVEAMTLGDRIAVIDKGRLQQVGTPEELYFAPANRFVAGFIGSPSMNFAPARLRAGDPVTVEFAGYVWPLPEALDRWPELSAYLDRTVIIGLRPDAFTIAPAASAQASLRVTPVSVESLGNEKHLLFAPPLSDGVPSRALDDAEGGALWTAKVGPLADLAVGHEVALSVDLVAAYFFDPDTATAITARQPSVAAAGTRAAALTGSSPAGQ